MNFQSPAFQPSLPHQAPDPANLTSRDLSSHLGPVAGTGGLNVQFFWIKVRSESANPERNGKYVNRLCVAKMPKGDRLTIATRFITEEQAMRDFPREFAMFKENQDVPTQGTPLHELPGITQSQIGILLLYNLRCVEDVAACADEHINAMGYDAREAKKLAARWVAKRDSNADVIDSAKLEAARDAEMTRLRKSQTELERRNIELEAQLKAFMSMQGGSGQSGGPAQLGGLPGSVQMVDRPDDLPDARDVESRLLEGGMVDGNDDLDDDPPAAPTKADPLGLKAGK